jgi:hypothetical protein
VQIPRTREEALGKVEAELRAEMAASLGRVGKQLDALLERLGGIEAQLATASGPARQGLVGQHQQLRKEAEHCAWKLVVQREAMGLFHHAVVAEKYPIPPPIKS